MMDVRRDVNTARQRDKRKQIVHAGRGETARKDVLLYPYFLGAGFFSQLRAVLCAQSAEPEAELQALNL